MHLVFRCLRQIPNIVGREVPFKPSSTNHGLMETETASAK